MSEKPFNFIFKGRAGISKREQIAKAAEKLAGDKGRIVKLKKESDNIYLDLGDDSDQNYIEYKCSPGTMIEQKKLSTWSAFTSENYLSCNGYAPGPLKQLIDKVRRPNWFRDEEVHCVWSIRLNNLVVNYEDCIKYGVIVTKKTEQKKKEDNKKTTDRSAKRLERYENYFKIAMKVGDYVVVPYKVNRKSIIAVGVINSDCYTEIPDEKNENVLDKMEGISEYYIRNVIWYWYAAEGNKGQIEVLNDDKNVFQNNYLYPKLDLTPAELVDRLLEQGLFEDSINKEPHVIILSNVNTKYYKKRLGKLRDYIKPEKTENTKFKLDLSKHTFWIPENLHFIGYMHEDEKGTKDDVIKNQFKIIDPEIEYTFYTGL